METMRGEHTDRKGTVLVLEEEKHERDYIGALLRHHGFRVLRVQDSDAALRLLEGEEPIDALVADAHVPGSIDGNAVVATTRARWPRIAAVMISGHSDETSGALPDGAHFVAKPYLPDRLVPLLERLLSRETR